MNIAYSCNDFYVPQTGVSMISLFENNREEDHINIYFIHIGVSKENIDLLKSLCDKYHRNFIPIDFNDIAYDLKLSATGRHIKSIYAKVFFARIPGVDKMIYLDSDTIITGSLRPLWDTDLDGCYLGAVKTMTTKRSELGMDPDDDFFNDGMTVMNVDYCRRNNLIEKVLRVVEEYAGYPPVLSEGALNKVCRDHVRFLSLRYNLMAGLLYLIKNDSAYMAQLLRSPEQDLVDSCRNPVVIHFLTAFYNRPWLTPCKHPLKYEYDRYLAISPWAGTNPRKSKLPVRIRAIDIMIRILGYKTYHRIISYIK